jgi:hypothetical protein
MSALRPVRMAAEHAITYKAWRVGCDGIAHPRTLRDDVANPVEAASHAALYHKDVALDQLMDGRL